MEFSSKTKQMFPGDKMPKQRKNPEKNGNWGSISNVMAKKSTEIKFKYKIAVNGIFS
jgi:hypothetical protein